MSLSRRACRFTFLCFGCLSLVLLAVRSADATQVWDRPSRGVVGTKLGIISGTETRGDYTLRTTWDKTLQVFADIPLIRRVAVQFAFDFHSFHNNRVDNWMLDMNVGLKPSVPIPRANMVLKPGVAVGYGHVGNHASHFENTDYLTVRVFTEADFEINRKTSWLAELSVLFTPSGGRNSYDLRLGPVFLFRVGLALR